MIYPGIAISAVLIFGGFSGCGPADTPNPEKIRQAGFDRKVICADAAARSLKFEGDGASIQEAFYSPDRNSCVAVFTSGRRPNIDIFVEDTLTFESVFARGSSTFEEMRTAQAEVDKQVQFLKESQHH